MAHFSIILGLLLATLAAPAASAQEPLRWTTADAEALLRVADGVTDEGLDPADYFVERLRRALVSGDQSLDAAATDTFLRLAHDFDHGRSGSIARWAWHVADQPAVDARPEELLPRALGTHSVAASLGSLLPQHKEYRALKAALAATPRSDSAAIARLQANLDRWRWMPRDLPDRYLLVNVPGFELSVVERGETVARHRIIVGKVNTPTPQFGTTATGLIFNPWWDVPQSIIAESVGKLVRTNPAGAKAKGYVSTRSRGRLHVRQRPGPGNALGQMKLVMPNPHTIYIHDTPSKPLFDEGVRAFSHGCIRIQNPFDLADRLLEGKSGWDKARIDRVINGRVTTSVAFDRPIPVYVVYFTALLDRQGQLVSYPDIYRRDGAVIAALTGRAARTASRGGVSECSASATAAPA